MSDYATLNWSIKRSPIDLEPLDIDGPPVVLQASDRIDALNSFIRKQYTDQQLLARNKELERENRELKAALGEVLEYIGMVDHPSNLTSTELKRETEQFLDL